MAKTIFGMGTRQYLQGRVDGARLLHHLPGLKCLGNRHIKPLGRGQIGKGKHLRISGIADDYLRPVMARGVKRLLIFLKYEKGGTSGGKPPAKAKAKPAPVEEPEAEAPAQAPEAEAEEKPEEPVKRKEAAKATAPKRAADLSSVISNWDADDE